MLRRFQFIRSPSPAQFSGCQGYLQPGGEGTGTGGSWKKGKLHKFWERSAQRQRHSTGRKGREGKEPEPGKKYGEGRNWSQGETWAAQAPPGVVLTPPAHKKVFIPI